MNRWEGGPGQYPYVVYEAISRKRISKIEGQLRAIRSKGSRLRENRGKAGFQIVALTGYTQSGKTTLFNRLASESKEIGLKPFTTLSTSARKVSTQAREDSSDSFIMIDSIGFIEDLSPLLLSAFHTTLNELANSDLVLLFVDDSDDIETVTRKIAASHEIMNKEIHGVPILICINKLEKFNNKFSTPFSIIGPVQASRPFGSTASSPSLPRNLTLRSTAGPCGLTTPTISIIWRQFSGA